MLNNSDLRHGPEFDCNKQALLDRGVKPLTDVNAFRQFLKFIDMLRQRVIVPFVRLCKKNTLTF